MVARGLGLGERVEEGGALVLGGYISRIAQLLFK